MGSQDSSLSNTENQDSSSLTTVQQDDDKRETSSLNGLSSDAGSVTVVEKCSSSSNVILVGSSTSSISSFQRLTHENLRKREERAAAAAAAAAVACLEKPELQQRIVSESDDSSLNSELELDQAVYPDSDTGLESMSSAETHEANARCNVKDSHQSAATETDSLRQEVTRLKCDKLDLLRQNVVSVV